MFRDVSAFVGPVVGYSLMHPFFFKSATGEGAGRISPDPLIKAEIAECLYARRFGDAVGVLYYV